MEQLLAEGKTKAVLTGARPDTVFLEARHRLTGGDAARVAELEAIGVHKTSQAAASLGYLAAAGIPTAFLEQASPTRLLCVACEMIPLEFVVRRFAWGSYLKRNPEAKQQDGTPLRFDNPVCELFHKHSLVLPPASESPQMMSEDQARELYLREGAWAEGVFTDPYIATSLETSQAVWGLYDQRSPVSGAPLYETAPVLSDAVLQSVFAEMILPAFAALERAWAAVETLHGAVALVDIKFEVGRAPDGTLLLADVVDNDSWRIWPGADPKRQLDKQCFRDGEALSKVQENYAIVTELTQQFAA